MPTIVVSVKQLLKSDRIYMTTLMTLALSEKVYMGARTDVTRKGIGKVNKK